MTAVGNSEMNQNVVSLFGHAQVQMPDPLQELLNEAQAEAWEEDETPVMANRILVSENQFPEQSMFVLDQQLEQLKLSLGRLKFYVSDLDDVLPR